MNHRRPIPLLISAITLVVFSVAIFLLWQDHNTVFWITYGFSVLAILSVLGSSISMRPDTKQFAANLALVTISIIYLLANAGCSILLAGIFRIDASLYLVAHIIILGVFSIIGLLGFSGVRHINSQDK